MGDPYERVTGGRLAFKGGSLATRSKSIDKKKKKKRNKHNDKPPAAGGEASDFQPPLEEEASASAPAPAGGGEIYTIDAAKRLKYEQLFPVEAKKFGYDPNAKTTFSSVEDALDDRVKKKADRYCK